MPPNLDWTRDPVPTNLTPYQRLIRNVDWARTDLGPMDQWSRELRQTVRMMIADTAPVILYWGTKHTIIYNEAHVPLVGDNHPNMLGMNASDVFPDFWDSTFAIFIAEQRETGVTATGQASRLLMERFGFLEETYFDWRLVPVIGDDGTYLGGYGLPTDNTKRVIEERRTICLNDLSTQTAQASTYDALWQITISCLSQNDKDAPAGFMLCDEESLTVTSSPMEQRYVSVGSIGLPARHPLQSFEIDPKNPANALSSVILDALESSCIHVVSATDPMFAEYLPGIEWKGAGVTSSKFAIIPIKANTKTPAVIVIGLNPYREYDSSYQNYLRIIMDIVSSQLSKMWLSNELNYRAELATEATQNLERSELRFSQFAARSVCGLAIADISGKILFANDFWCDFSGVDPENAPGSDWRDYVHEDDLATLGGWWHKVVVLKQSATFQFRSKIPFKKGEIELPFRTAYATCYADLGEDGNVDTVTGLVVDISEHKWVEHQLLQRTRALAYSESRYRAFADLCPLGICSTDANGYIQMGNDAWHAFYGFKKGEVYDPEPWLPFIHPLDFEKCKQYFVDLQTTPGPHTVELRLKKRYVIYEGDRMIENDMYVIAAGIQEYKEATDGTKYIDHIDFWVTDISAQKMAEKLLTDKMEEAIRTRTQQERFIDMISHEIRNPLSAVLHCGDEIVDTLKQCLNELDNKALNGLSSTRDLHKPSHTEPLLRSALDSANTILYCVQHQKQIVDDVLTLSKLDSELLVVSPIPIKLTNLMHSAVKIFDPELRMAAINLAMIEDPSILEHGVDWLMLDPNRFMQIVINLLTNAIKFTRAQDVRQIKVTTSVHRDPPSHIQDLDFVPRRYGPAKTASGSQVDQNDLSNQIFLRVSVSDTGKGLTAEEKSLLFNRFAQASPKTSSEYGRSGLGLFISRQMTEMLGGEIGVGSSPSGGCTFAFYVATSKMSPPHTYRAPPVSPLPPQRTLSEPPRVDSKKDKNDHATVKVTSLQTKRKILVVEDNVINQKVLCKQLRTRGFEVEASNHGKEALAALEGALKSNKYFDVVLCDIEMPVMNGIEAVKEIRKREAEDLLPFAIPVIGVTANVRSKQVDAAIEAGMDGVTTKPYRIEDLIAHIDRLCREITPETP